MYKIILLISSLFLTIFPFNGIAAEFVPISIEKVQRVKSSNYLKLIGPGKVPVRMMDDNLKQEVELEYDYKGNIYISIDRIASMINLVVEDEFKNACTLRYVSGSYTKEISVKNQSCETIIQIMSK